MCQNSMEKESPVELYVCFLPTACPTFPNIYGGNFQLASHISWLLEPREGFQAILLRSRICQASASRKKMNISDSQIKVSINPHI